MPDIPLLVGSTEYKFHLIPVWYPLRPQIVCVISDGVVIDPPDSHAGDG